jgi:hypothetical protein
MSPKVSCHGSLYIWNSRGLRYQSLRFTSRATFLRYIDISMPSLLMIGRQRGRKSVTGIEKIAGLFSYYHILLICPKSSFLELVSPV